MKKIIFALLLTTSISQAQEIVGFLKLPDSFKDKAEDEPMIWIRYKNYEPVKYRLRSIQAVFSLAKNEEQRLFMCEQMGLDPKDNRFKASFK